MLLQSVMDPKWVFFPAVAAVQVAPFVRSSAGLRGHMCRGSLPEHLSELIKGRRAISELHAAPQPQADPPSSVCLSLYNVSTICFFLHLFLWLFFFPRPSCLWEAWVHLCFYYLYWKLMFMLAWCQADVLVVVVECNVDYVRVFKRREKNSHSQIYCIK